MLVVSAQSAPEGCGNKLPYVGRGVGPCDQSTTLSHYLFAAQPYACWPNRCPSRPLGTSRPFSRD